MLTLMGQANDLEEGTVQQLDFDKIGGVGRDGHQVLPVVLQEVESGEVLFVGYANEEALRMTLEMKSAVLYSTSRNQIWHKGATSGDTLSLIAVRVTCEQNSLLNLVTRDGRGACHTLEADGSSRSGCYYRSLTTIEDLAFIQ